MSVAKGSRLRLACEVSRLREELDQRDLESGQERACENIAGRGRELGGEREPVSCATVNADSLPVGIEHPILPHPKAVVALQLETLVAAAGALGADLDDQVWGAMNVLLDDDLRPLSAIEPQG